MNLWYLKITTLKEDTVLRCLEACFSRKVAFHRFVTITIGFLLCSDKLSVPSVIRDLALSPGCYEPLHFFRAASWSMADMYKRWFSAVRQYAPLYREGSSHVLPLLPDRYFLTVPAYPPSFFQLSYHCD